MQLGSSNKNASDQVLCYENQKTKEQPVTHCGQKVKDGPVALM